MNKMGENTSDVNPTDQLRSINRLNLRVLQEKQRSLLLKHRRLKLCEIEEITQRVTLVQFKELVAELKNKNVSACVLQKIKNACASDEYIETFFRTEGAFEALVRILLCRDAQKQLNAVACFTNLACGQHKVSYKIAKRVGAYLISFISGRSPFLQDQSAWTAGNLAKDCIHCYTVLSDQGIIPALADALKFPLAGSIQSIVFAVSACLLYEDADSMVIIQRDVTKRLLSILNEDNAPVPLLVDAAFILVKFCYWGISRKIAVISIETSEAILNCLNNAVLNESINTMISVPLLRCLGYLICDEIVCIYLLQCDRFLSCLKKIMSSECLHLKRELLWIFSTILASNIDHAQHLDIMPNVKDIKLFLKADDVCVIQALYYLTCLSSLEETIFTSDPDLLSFIQSLSNCDNKNVQNAAKTLFNTIGAKT